MTLAEAIYQHSLNLPDPVAREALDFIQFLEQRHGVKSAMDLPTNDDTKRSVALSRLSAIKHHFAGKPIPDRAALYDGARG